MVFVNYMGMMGNNLFQYALARIIAEKLGYALNPAFPNELDLPNATVLDGKRIEGLHEEVLSGHIVDLDAVLTNTQDRKIILNGYFQRVEYYVENRADIKKWFQVEPFKNSYCINSRDVVLHIRRGNYKKTQSIVDLGFYIQVLDNAIHDRVFVCGVGVDQKTKSALQKYNPIYTANKPIEDFSFIQSFNKIVQSTSTFCWWAAFLSNAKEIYMPCSKTGYWGENSPINLSIKADNYIYIKDVTTGTG